MACDCTEVDMGGWAKEEERERARRAGPSLTAEEAEGYTAVRCDRCGGAYWQRDADTLGWMGTPCPNCAVSDDHMPIERPPVWERWSVIEETQKGIRLYVDGSKVWMPKRGMDGPEGWWLRLLDHKLYG